jgi:hypothetical protein
MTETDGSLPGGGGGGGLLVLPVSLCWAMSVTNAAAYRSRAVRLSRLRRVEPPVLVSVVGGLTMMRDVVGDLLADKGVRDSRITKAGVVERFEDEEGGGGVFDAVLVAGDADNNAAAVRALTVEGVVDVRLLAGDVDLVQLVRDEKDDRLASFAERVSDLRAAADLGFGDKESSGDRLLAVACCLGTRGGVVNVVVASMFLGVAKDVSNLSLAVLAGISDFGVGAPVVDNDRLKLRPAGQGLF